MKVYVISLSIIACLSPSCNKKEQSFSESNNNPKIVHETVYSKGDTIYSKNDTIVRFVKTNNNAGIFYWGIKNKFENKSKDTVAYNYFNREKLKKIENYSVFKDGCGSGCEYMFLMEFSKGKTGRKVMFPLLESFKSNIIVYKGESEDDLLVIENLNTGKQVHIKEDYNKNLRPQTLAIDTIYLKDVKTLFVSWQGSDSSKKSKSFKID
jgi:hypothetical protein